MEDVAKILYERFFLRDYLGKIGPGGVGLLAVRVLLWPSDRLLKLDAIPDWLLWLCAIPTAYAAGLILQSLGESIGLVTAAPRPVFDRHFRVGWRAAYGDFRERMSLIRHCSSTEWTDRMEQQRERYVVLKEVSGHFAIALLTLAAAIVLRYRLGAVLQSSVLVIAAVLLLTSHFRHASRQALFEIESLMLTGRLTPDAGSAMLKRVQR